MTRPLSSASGIGGCTPEAARVTIHTDTRGRITQVEGAAETLFGESAEGMRGRMVGQYLPSLGYAPPPAIAAFDLIDSVRTVGGVKRIVDVHAEADAHGRAWRFSLCEHRNGSLHDAPPDWIADALDAFPGTFAIYDSSGCYRYVNRTLLDLVGLTSDQMVGRRDEELFPAGWMAGCRPALHAAMRLGRPQRTEVALEHQGKRRMEAFTYVPQVGPSGRLRGVVVTSQEVTVQRAIEEDVKARHRELSLLYSIARIAWSSPSLQEVLASIVGAIRSATGFSSVSVELYDEAHQTVSLSAAVGLRAETDVDPIPVQQAITGLAIRAEGPVLEQDLERDPEYLDLIPRSAGAFLCVPMVHERTLGVLALWERQPRGIDRRLVAWMQAAADFIALIIERSRAEEALRESESRLAQLANYDPLTELPNRNLFFDRARHGLEKAARNGRKLALLFIDLDNFKVINDRCGHERGDAVLREAARRLRGAVREVDTVARLGGDEFVVMLEDFPDPALVADTAERILDNLDIAVLVDGSDITVTGSIGISICPDDGTGIADLIRLADKAMYAAKRKGRNTYQFHSGGIDRIAHRRISMETEIRHGLANEEFFLVYQPQIDLLTGRPVVMEAAIRWVHPREGVLHPDRFLPLAESSGLIISLGHYVFERICRDASDWRKSRPDLLVSMNVSLREFRDKGLLGMILAETARAGIQPESIELEVTDAALLADPERACDTVLRLRDIGVHLALDDFGTGFCSLDQLSRVGIERLKIDGRFVGNASPGNKGVVAAVVDLAHHLDSRAVAEGVETKEQADFLSATGCDEVQGFYFCEPLCTEELRRRYAL